MTEIVNGFMDGGHGDEARSRGRDVGIGVCGYKDWVGGRVKVMFSCPSEADIV